MGSPSFRPPWKNAEDKRIHARVVSLFNEAGAEPMLSARRGHHKAGAEVNPQRKGYGLHL